MSFGNLFSRLMNIHPARDLPFKTKGEWEKASEAAFNRKAVLEVHRHTSEI